MGYINEVIKKREYGDLEDAHIEIKLFAVRHDTRKNPVPIGLEKYLQLEKMGRLKYSTQIHGILNPKDIFDLDERLRYHIYSEEKVDVLKWMEHKTR